MYGLTELHTDEFFADRAREMASWDGVERIYVEDAPGVLTPERAATLLAGAAGGDAGDVRLEIHVHNTTGLAPLVYVEGDQGRDRPPPHRSLPLANGPSLPSTEAMVEIVEELGHTHDLDKSQLQPVADHFEREAARLGYEIGVPNEYRMLPYQHQLPGGMTGTLKNQLNEYGMPEQLPRGDRRDRPSSASELGAAGDGDPVLAVRRHPGGAERGHRRALQGGPRRSDPVRDGPLRAADAPGRAPRSPTRSSPSRGSKELEGWERDQHARLAEFRKRLGQNLSDEELLLRYFCPEEQVDKMLAGPPLRTEPAAATDGVGAELTRLIEEANARPVSHISLSLPGVKLDLRRNGAE